MPPAEEGEGTGMRIEQHILRLARIGPDKWRSRPAKPHMRNLHAHRFTSDLHVLVAPVELVGLTGPIHQRDEDLAHIPRINTPLTLPAGRVPPHCIIGTAEPFSLKQIVDPRHPQPIAAG